MARCEFDAMCVIMAAQAGGALKLTILIKATPRAGSLAERPAYARHRSASPCDFMHGTAAALGLRCFLEGQNRAQSTPTRFLSHCILP